MTNRTKNASKYHNDVFLWLHLIFTDNDLRPSTAKVGTALSLWINHERRDAWPSQTKLAEFTGLTRRTINQAIKQLNEGGYLRVLPPTENRRSNTYVMQIPKVQMRNVPHFVLRRIGYHTTEITCSHHLGPPDHIIDEQGITQTGTEQKENRLGPVDASRPGPEARVTAEKSREIMLKTFGRTTL